MEIMIELTEVELDLVAGGSGTASFSFTNTASGTTAIVTGRFDQATTPSSASQGGGLRRSHPQAPLALCKIFGRGSSVPLLFDLKAQGIPLRAS